MKNNKNIFLVVLVAITFVFLGMVIFLVTKKSVTPTIQVSKIPVSPTTAVMGPVSLLLKPAGNIVNGTTFPIEIEYTGLEKTIIASDILLTFDTTKLEFIGVQNVHEQYMNPRKLFENNTLIVSFIQKPTSVKPAFSTSIVLGQLLFKAKQSGTATISPILNSGSRSSLTFIEGNQYNQLGKANVVDIVIK